MCKLPDHPVVQNLLQTGTPDGRAPEEMRCPICNEDAEFYYVNKSRAVVGCECCLTMRHYYEFEQEEKD